MSKKIFCQEYFCNGSELKNRIYTRQGDKGKSKSDENTSLKIGIKSKQNQVSTCHFLFFI